MLDIILLIVAEPKIWLSICPKQGGMREGASLDFLLKTTKEWLSIYIQFFCEILDEIKAEKMLSYSFVVLKRKSRDAPSRIPPCLGQMLSHIFWWNIRWKPCGENVVLRRKSRDTPCSISPLFCSALLLPQIQNANKEHHIFSGIFCFSLFSIFWGGNPLIF